MTERLSISTGGVQGTGFSAGSNPDMTPDGRFVVFETGSSFVAADTNGVADVYLRDRQLGTTSLISIPSAGGQGNSHSFQAAISDDARFVTFYSEATNMVPGDTNAVSDIFLRDRALAQTSRVSVSSAAAQANLRSSDPAISGDGNFIAFQSDASNLVAGDTNARTDVFLFDRSTSQTTRVSVDSGGGQADRESAVPSLNLSGRYVAFQSSATNLVPGDTNICPSFTIPGSCHDVFIHDTQSGLTSRVSITSAGGQADRASFLPKLSDNGMVVVFQSDATNLDPPDTNNRVDIFVRDLSAGTTSRVSESSQGAEGSGSSFDGVISGDGAFVAYASSSPELVDDDTNAANDVFIHDRLAAQTTRVSISSTGAQGNAGSRQPALGSTGTFVAFESDASNLVAGDTNGKLDAFIHEPILIPPDSVSPIVTGAPDRAPNVHGWYDASVTIDWTSEDPEPSSGPPTDPPNTIADVEGANVEYTSEESCDPAGNCAAGSLSLSIDLTDPVVTCQPQPTFEIDQVGAEVSATADDVTSGPGAPLVSATVDTSTLGVHSVDLTGEDLAGRTTTVTCTYRVRESGFPIVVGVPDRAPNGNGWYDASVTIDWQAEDPEPSSGQASDPSDTVADTEGANVVYDSEPSCDPDGNCAAGSLTLSIDETDPVVTCETPPAFILNQPGAVLAATVDDALSGPVTPLVSSSIDTSAVGTYTVSLTGEDLAGRTTTVGCSYSVGYVFSGFFSPVDNLPTVNVANAGQAIPLKWRLTDYAGNPISDPASFVSVTSGSDSCGSSDPRDAIEEYAGASGLLYQGDGNWQFTWKTPKSYAGKCRVMYLELADGIERTAHFQFR